MKRKGRLSLDNRNKRSRTRGGLLERSLGMRFAPGEGEGRTVDQLMQYLCLNYLLVSSLMCTGKMESPLDFPDLASYPRPLSHQRY